jgi:hypothetical protein
MRDEITEETIMGENNKCSENDSVEQKKRNNIIRISARKRF